MLQDCSCPAHVDVSGDMPVMSMVDKTYMYIRSLKRETRQVFPDCYGKQEKPMPVSKLTCGKFPVVRRDMTVQIQQICLGLWLAIWALFGTKVTWVWWCGFNLRRPSCKAKNNWLLPSYQYSHYWQQSCPRMPSLFGRWRKRCTIDTGSS